MSDVRPEDYGLQSSNLSLSLYVLTDYVNGRTPIMLGLAYTDGAFIREIIPFCNSRNPNWLNDYSVYCVGSVDGLDFSSRPARLVSWDAYKAPEITKEVK